MSRVNDFLPSGPEMWGGIECTINRINDRWHDQLDATGHYSRYPDINLLGNLGIKSIRYPILWERHQPHRDFLIDWSWVDSRLSAIRDCGITPIAGLLHHGSGPCFTDLLSPAFADDFASYAGQVAARFPWLEHYTPVNEPLTTARFSGLYGIWYPHQTDPQCFVRMLLHQLEATVKAMKAIRSVNPAARLIQTEDLAKIHSTPALAYQADFENHRRWLTFDVLAGRLDKMHPLWDYLSFIGIREDELAFFTANPCLPDIIGVNYYVTSERFLDEDLEKYDLGKHGGNGKQKYADVEAVRVIRPAGLLSLLAETWDRYKLPIAITEAHLHCTREEQMRWLMEIWQSARSARNSGIDIRAVTAWALLGAFDWDSLLTREEGHYESGAFEIREGKPQITAVGHMIRSLADTGDCDHPLLEGGGWWRRPGSTKLATRPTTLGIIGPAGPLLAALFEICRRRGIDYDWISFDVYTLDTASDWWAVISVGASGEEMESISAASGIRQICYGNLADDQDIDGFLDRFLDREMEIHTRSIGSLTHLLCQ